MNPASNSRVWLRPLLVFLAAVSCFFWAAWSYGGGERLGVVEQVEAQSNDRFFLWRHRFFPGQAKVDPRILLVTIDSPTEMRLGKPSILWTQDLAEISSKLLEAGALAVGIDFAGDPEVSKSPQVFRDLLAVGHARLQDALLTGKVVIIENDASRGVQSPAWPDSVVAFAEDGRNSCMANLLADPDGTIRSVPLSSLQLESGWVNHTFSLRLAELVLGKSLQVQDSKWSWPDAPLPSRGQALRINYPGPAGTLPRVSLSKILDQPSLEQYRGKVLLIVPDFLFDRHATPFILSGQHSLGGEIHAAALNTVLTGQYLVRLERLSWALIVGLGCLVAGLLGAYRVPLFALLSTLFLGLAYLATAFWFFAHYGLILPLMSLGIALTIGVVGGLAAQFVTLEERRRSLQQLFGRMVSHQVADAMLQSVQRRAERRQITLLFSDINGFTPTCERLAPEEVLSMLNHYFHEMVALIDARGGYVKQFVGDEIMAIYGAPKPSSSHPKDAVYTAIEMLERLDFLRQRDPQGEGGFYSVKIGINTGEAVLGSVGSAERWEYAAVGDDVNLAARLESLTTRLGVDILVSKFTRDLVTTLPEGWRWKSLGVQKFKGKTSELEVFTLEKAPSKEA